MPEFKLQNFFDLFNNKKEFENLIKNLKCETSINSLNIIKEMIITDKEKIKDIEKSINNIIKDNMISIQDLPYLINILNDIIAISKYDNSIKITTNNCIDFIEFIIKYVLEKCVKGDKNNDIYNMIDVCISLLRTNVNQDGVIYDSKNKNNNFSCCK